MSYHKILNLWFLHILHNQIIIKQVNDNLIHIAYIALIGFKINKMVLCMHTHELKSLIKIQNENEPNSWPNENSVYTHAYQLIYIYTW